MPSFRLSGALAENNFDWSGRQDQSGLKMVLSTTLIGGFMWSGISFDTDPMIEGALSLLNQFMPLILVLGGVALFGLVMLILVAVTRKASGA